VLQGQQAAKCPPGRAYRNYWQAHIKAALKEGTLPVVILSSQHFLPKASEQAHEDLALCRQFYQALRASFQTPDAHHLSEESKNRLWNEVLPEIAEDIAKEQRRLESKPMPFDSVPFAAVYPLSVLSSYLGCKPRYLFAILRIHGVSYYPVRAPGAKETVWVVLASNRLEEVFNSLALRRNLKPLKLASLACPLIDIYLLPEEHRSLAYALCALAAKDCPQWRLADYQPLSWQGFTLLPWRIVQDFAVLSIPKGAAQKISRVPLATLKRMGFRRLMERLPAWLRRSGDEKFRKGLPDDLYHAFLTLKRDIERGQLVRRSDTPLFDPTYIIRCAIVEFKWLVRSYPEDSPTALRTEICDRFSVFNRIASAAKKVPNYLAAYLERWADHDRYFRFYVDDPVREAAKDRWMVRPIPSLLSWPQRHPSDDPFDDFHNIYL
jgi:hypothetical protein